ncbi:MAG TPA: hypothetical protein VHW96_12145 [Solirubrobacteraceae bacterium]|jgi:hypothetical protein|nr:hypothetical protein [Solirubrobacteraceae bacterium]
MANRPVASAASASTTDFPAGPASSAAGRTAPRAISSLFPSRNFYFGLVLVTLTVGALSLLIPSTPSYDPWSWLVWSRQIIHGHLTITSGGTSWKPLPMIFTIPFALFGKAAPDLWLVVARAGALAAVAMVFRLAYRLTRRVGGLFGEADASLDRLTTIAPALLAGVIGAVALALSASGGFVSSNALGYSEGFAAALLLISIDRHIDGKPRQAFVVGFLVALDRPEIWLFWGPYGLWLFWKDPGARMLVAALFVITPIVWFLPVYLGCGSFSCSVNRATHPRSNSLAFASDPFVAELKRAAWPTMLLRIKVVAVLLGLAVAGILWSTYRRSGLAGLRTDRSQARLTAALLGLGGLAWFVVIAVMTQVGFSGNNRYLVLGSAMVDICGAVGFGWAAQELAVLAARRRRGAEAGAGAGSGAGPGSGRTALSTGLQWTAAVIVALIFVALPNWVGHSMISIPRTHGSLVYQARLRDGMNDLIKRFGGADKVLGCGSVMTEGFQVPMVAFVLDVPTTRIEAPPTLGGAANPEPAGDAPHLILQTRDTRSAHLLPFLSTWPSVHYHYAGTAGPVHMFTQGCSGRSS